MKFPKDFLWGCSTAAHQVEGNNIHSDWWHWENSDSNRFKSGIACDHYNLFKQDFALAKKLGHNAHRLSIEWARIEPREGTISKKEIAHYREVLKELRRLRIKTFVTLWHFTNPKWFADLGGFEKRENLKYFDKFVELCAKEFGDLVDYWLTVNEPSTYVLKSYLIKLWPPQKSNFFSALNVYVNLGLAHKNAYKIIHSKITNAQVGFVHQLVSYYPESDNWLDKITAKTMSYFANDLFLNVCGDTHDFFGLNYYFKNPASLKYVFKKIPTHDLIKTINGEGKSLGWDMDPNGVIDVLRMAWNKFKKPIYILEHGIADTTDKIRAEYLKVALRCVNKALKEGIDVRSYLHWSLIDNYEWQFGFEPRFGLAAVDFLTQKRTPRESSYQFRDIMTNHDSIQNSRKR